MDTRQRDKTNIIQYEALYMLMYNDFKSVAIVLGSRRDLEMDRLISNTDIRKPSLQQEFFITQPDDYGVPLSVDTIFTAD